MRPSASERPTAPRAACSTDDPYWALLDAVGFLPGAVNRPPGLEWDRLEAYVATLLEPSSLRASSRRS